MFAHGEDGRFGREGPVIVAAENLEGAAQLFAQGDGSGGKNNFRRAQSFQFRHQSRFIFQFGGEKVAGGKVYQRQAHGFAAGVNGGQKVISLRHQHPFVKMRAGRKNLGDLAFDQLAGLGFLKLFADGHLTAAAQDARNVGVGRVKRQAAHGNAVAGGERQIQDRRPGLGVLEKHLIKIPQAEQQQGIGRQFAFDAAVLRHHGSELRFGGHAGKLS